MAQAARQDAARMAGDDGGDDPATARPAMAAPRRLRGRRADDRGRPDRAPLHRHADRRAVAALARQPRPRRRPAAGALAGAVRGGRRARAAAARRARSRPRRVAPILLGGTLVLRLALAAGARRHRRVGPRLRRGALVRGAERVPARRCRRSTLGPRFFLDRFAELVPVVPGPRRRPSARAAAGHARARRSTRPARLAAFCIAAGALSAPLTYGLARELLDERGARLAGLLMALVAAGADVRRHDRRRASTARSGCSRRGRSPGRRGARGCSGRCCSPSPRCSRGRCWRSARGRRSSPGAATGCARRSSSRSICGVVLVALHGAFSALTGFDPIGTVRATEEVYRLGVASVRPYWYWLLGSPVGVPARARAADRVAGAARARARHPGGGGDLRRARHRRGDGLHEGRDRADLALLRAVRVPRRGARAGAPAGARSCPWRPRWPPRRCFTSCLSDTVW